MTAQATRDIILQTGALAEALTFYRDTLGLTVFEQSGRLLGFDAGAIRLFVEPGAVPGPVLEFLVDDLNAARARLVAAGCVVVDDQPDMPRCYLRDPFGLVFNIAARHADPPAG